MIINSVKYTFSSVYSTRKNESDLLLKEKELISTRDLQKRELSEDEAGLVSENIHSEAYKLRQQLLKHRNELAQAEERQYQLDYKVDRYLLAKHHDGTKFRTFFPDKILTSSVVEKVFNVTSHGRSWGRKL